MTTTSGVLEFAAIGRLLQRHRGPIFHLIEDLFGQHIVEVHQEIAAGSHSARVGCRPQGQAGRYGPGGAADLHARQREDRAGRDRTHPASRFRHSMTMRRVQR